MSDGTITCGGTEGAPVVLDAEPLEDRRRSCPATFSRWKANVDELAVAEREELHRGPVAVDGEPDHVDRAHRLLVRRLTCGEALDRPQPVAVPSGLLEPLLGRLAHPRSSARRIGRVSPERNPITPSTIAP